MTKVVKIIASTAGCFVLSMLICSCETLPPNLPKAAELGKVDAVRKLIRRGAPLEQRDELSGDTALLIASRRGDVDTVAALQKAGADLNARTTNDETALTIATGRCRVDAAHLLISSGADVNAKNKENVTSPLISAANCNNPSLIGALIRGGARINDTNAAGITALIAASIKGHEAAVNVLLAYGADTEVYGPKTGTALYEASQGGHLGVVRLLISKGAKLDWQSPVSGWSPLIVAVTEGRLESASALLSARCKPDLADAKGRTALIYAALSGNGRMIDLLLKAGANPNIVPTDGEGNTVLMAVAAKGQAKIVKLLLDQGADYKVRNRNGKTALAFATQQEVADVLRRAGAKE